MTIKPTGVLYEYISEWMYIGIKREKVFTAV